MKKLQAFRFDGAEGINRFETWRKFKEIRFDYLFVRPRFVRVSKLQGRRIREDKVRIEVVEKVEIHIRSNGLVEAYGPPALIERAMDKVSVLGGLEQISFASPDFNRMIKMAADIRKIKIRGAEDKKISEITLKGGALTRSGEFKRLKKGGRIKAIQGKIELEAEVYGFAMTENELRFFVRDPKKDQSALEAFVSAFTA